MRIVRGLDELHIFWDRQGASGMGVELQNSILDLTQSEALQATTRVRGLVSIAQQTAVEA